MFNAADLAVVGNFSGKEAMAAVGGNAPVIGLLVNLFVGISLGSNVIIAKSIGQGDDKNISRAVHTSVFEIWKVCGSVFAGGNRNAVFIRRICKGSRVLSIPVSVRCNLWVIQPFQPCADSLEKERCVSCMACEKACPVSLSVREISRSPECIRCGRCVEACPNR